jgi:hypothetical protein
MEECQLDNEKRRADYAPDFLDEIDCRSRCAAGGQQIIDQHHSFAFLNRVDMHVPLGVTVLELVRGADRLEREFAFFSDRNTAMAEILGNGSSEQKAACIDADHFGRIRFLSFVGKVVDYPLE